MNKKMGIILASIAVASCAVADVATFWENKGYVYNESFTALIGAGSTAQLIWCPASAGDTGGSGYTGGEVDTAAGEILLATASVDANTQWGSGALAITVTTTQIADVNSGYFFTRVFDDAGAGITTANYFIDIAMESPTLTEYNSSDPNTIYGTPVYASTEYGNVTEQVIPEPATIGMMGIAGIGMFLARKKSRR